MSGDFQTDQDSLPFSRFVLQYNSIGITPIDDQSSLFLDRAVKYIKAKRTGVRHFFVVTTYVYENHLKRTGGSPGEVKNIRRSLLPSKLLYEFFVKSCDTLSIYPLTCRFFFFLF